MVLFSRFKFIDLGPMVDHELTLVSPAQRYLDELLEAEALSGTADLDDLRRRTEAFLEANPHGRQRADRLAGKVPAYHFWMRLDPRQPAARQIPCRIVGGIGFRVGQNPELELYTGHFGYHVYPPARGHHFAERACRLLFPLARHHRISPLWITTNPDNFASRRTCERLGATLVDIVDIPPDHPFQSRGETQKCRFRLDL